MSVKLCKALVNDPAQRCGVCGVSALESSTGRLVADHNHQTGMVRGPLCDLCNAYIGIFESILKGAQKELNQRYRLWTEKYHDKIIEQLSRDSGIRFRIKGPQSVPVRSCSFS
jgi:hypothetical protein